MNTAVTVLVIDDSNTIRRSAEAFLRQAGFNVVLAEDGFDALAKITDHHPEVIFVDIMMPRLDGFAVLSALRADPWLAGVRVLMLTAKGRETEVAKGLALGADAYITKPFATRELLDTLLLWKPNVVLDAKGEAQIEVPLNDALTTFQVVAVADAGGGLGSIEVPVRATLSPYGEFTSSDILTWVVDSTGLPSACSSCSMMAMLFQLVQASTMACASG